jgi:YVTN family beta-propeller protein
VSVINLTTNTVIKNITVGIDPTFIVSMGHTRVRS